jgi:hypothetical protein
MAEINSDSGKKTIHGIPSDCPFCHKKITPNYLFGHTYLTSLDLTVFCPNQECSRSFIAYYEYNRQNGHYDYTHLTSIGNLIGKEFSEVIKSISENFTLIYNQAFTAEQQNLTEICGVGYRKALEYLIKDYLILNKPDEKEKVEKKLLGSCISEYVDDNRIKTVSKRAVWLGNDETHYVRKWEGKNLDDLKKLIDLTIHWIEMEQLTKDFENEMPE